MAMSCATGMATGMVTGMGTGMATTPVRCGPVVRMNASKRNPTAKPEKKEGVAFLQQLVEWTLRSSMKETDPILKKVAEEKKAADPTPPAEKKGLFGLNL